MFFFLHPMLLYLPTYSLTLAECKKSINNATYSMLIFVFVADIEKSLVTRQVVEPDQSNTLTPTMAPTFHIPLSPSPLGVTAGRLVEPHGKLAPMGSVSTFTVLHCPLI